MGYSGCGPRGEDGRIGDIFGNGLNMGCKGKISYCNSEVSSLGNLYHTLRSRVGSFVFEECREFCLELTWRGLLGIC